ncbi:hypothetical protein Pmar_PMAR005182 [Perkinsus marinus ATCC 50983]|uniref:Uncharacterized protein n=1 Tax=Perkinsus marinus (strain ATCC 50983 / TXsc) TaxID=423536 RepID=C5KAV1_PERM5|nr:hypothetical protein Pmar_PMAR005182 [Perkinsus marinus ATCC 50983]EER18277.1 hypothetical protein Pmar_PMAR005182 [Perkinsus marinus ATCC 50983]|eukprot:XP_002786481.1 hypothetical protein Pmar_PMAR005182 [Perkinsus marinus ATCC 50983]
MSVQQPSEQIYEHDVDFNGGAYGEAPMGTWRSMAIAPPLPSARDIVSMDFQEAFVRKCLYPSQSFLVSEGFVEEEEKQSEKQDEVAIVKIRTPRRPSEPQPDYFGHLLGHPMCTDEDDEEETPDVRVADQPEVKVAATDSHEEADEDVRVEDPESVVAVERVETPEVKDEIVMICPESQPVPSESEKDHEISEKSTEDDDVDYFGHIMGHPMNHSGSQRKIKSPKVKEEAPKVEEVDSQESQGSVLGLFLGGVEVCDREENIGQFAARPKEDSGDSGVVEGEAEDHAALEADECNAPESEAVEKAPEVVDSPKTRVVQDAVKSHMAQECSVPPSPEVTACIKQEINAPAFARRPSREPEVVPARSSIEVNQTVKAERLGAGANSTRITTKKKSFFAGLCGSRSHD